MCYLKRGVYRLDESLFDLGGIISSDREITGKTSQSIGRRRTHMMTHKNVKLTTNIKVYKAVVLTSLFYGCET